MKNHVLPLFAAVALTILSIITAFAAEMVKAGDLEITSAWTRATLPGQPAGAGYLTIENKGTVPDRLLSASSLLAPMAQIHEMKMQGDVMKMGELKDGLEVPAGGKVELAPGGLHIMFMGLKDGIKEGDIVKVTLTFEKAGDVEVDLAARPADAKAMMQMHGG